MQKRKNQTLILIFMLILVGIYITNEQQFFNSGIKKEIAQILQDCTEKSMLPGGFYKKQKENIYLYLVEKALEILPMGNQMFMKENLNVEDQETFELMRKLEAQDEEVDEQITSHVTSKKVDLSISKLKDFDYLISKFYTVDSVTYIKPSDFDIEKMLKTDLKIKKQNGPKILIFHTHSQEKFADSGKYDGFSIVDAGERLENLLEEKYGIETLHHEGVYDKINGKLDRSQAYERARPEIMKILEENPTIEVVIDLHRDGVGKDTRLVTEIDGKKTAQIMFFNGMCRTRTNGDLAGMGNPYINTNLTFSLQMKITAETYYPGFTRRNYLKGYKYNMDLAPKMLLIEAGAQTNTVKEIKNAMEPLAEILHLVVGY